MNRLPAIRTLATALLGTLLAVGGIAPASAQQRGGGLLWRRVLALRRQAV